MRKLYTFNHLFMQHLYSFKDLTSREQELLIRFPVYLSLMAAREDHKLDNKERKTVIKLTHIKKFACDPRLADYYAAVDKDFESSVTEISADLPKAEPQRELAIKRELNHLRLILRKLDEDYAASLYSSLRSYTSQVHRAHRHILEYFLFPLPINGMTD